LTHRSINISILKNDFDFSGWIDFIFRYYHDILSKQSAEVRKIWLDMTTIVGDKLLNDHPNYLQIRNTIYSNGLNADSIKASLKEARDMKN
jgi:hypothetical protein